MALYLMQINLIDKILFEDDESNNFININLLK